MANDKGDDVNAYPEEWGYTTPRTGALEAAFDVYAAALSDDEFNALVSRTRQGGN